MTWTATDARASVEQPLEVTGTYEAKTGKYFFLNERTKKGDRVTVKARNDGTFLCLNAECVRSVRPLLHMHDTRGGCVHARFVRDLDAPLAAAADDAPAHDDRDALTLDAPSDDEFDDADDAAAGDA